MSKATKFFLVMFVLCVINAMVMTFGIITGNDMLIERTTLVSLGAIALMVVVALWAGILK